MQAPLAALFLLKQGPENRIEPVSEAEAARELLRHVLFFAQDQELVWNDFPDHLRFCEARAGPPAGVYSGCARMGVDWMREVRSEKLGVRNREPSPKSESSDSSSLASAGSAGGFSVGDFGIETPNF